MRKTSTKIFFNSLFGIFVLLLFSTMANPAFSQNLEASYWYFAEQLGLHFTPSPSKDTNNVLFGNGRATISDKDGNLLLYSNFAEIRNGSHQQVSNSFTVTPGINNDGQSLLTKIPHSDSLYLLAQVNANSNSTTRFFYSIIDITANNGQGEVLNSHRYIFVKDSLANKLTILQHANDTDFWLVCLRYDGSLFYSYLLTQSGLDTTPVITQIGKQYSPLVFADGSMKSSPDSEKIALIKNVGLGYTTGWAELFQFNRLTGQPYNPLIINLDRVHGFNVDCSFSTNSKKFYTAYKDGSSLPDTSYILQYDVSVWDSITIESTKNKFLYTSVNPFLNGMTSVSSIQIGLDGNIYFLNVSAFPIYIGRLSCINTNNPIFDTAFTYESMNSRLLPTLNQTLFVNAHILQAQNKSGPICPGDSARLVAYGAGADRFIWTLHDGSAANSLSNDTLPNPLAFPDSTTTYRVVGIASSCTVDNLDTAYITVVVNPTPSSPFGNAVLVCNNDTASLALPFASNVLWSTGDTSQSIQLSQQGSYWFVYTDSNGCQSDTLHFQVQEQDSGQIQLNAPNQVCANQTVEATASGASPVVWQNVGNPIVVDSQRLVFRADTSFWLVASSASPCILPDSVFVEVIPAPHFGANTDSVLCLPDSFSFSPNTTSQSNLRFVWLGETDTLSMSDFPQKFWVDSVLSKQLIAFVFSGCYDTLDVQLRVKETDVLPNSAFELKQSCEGLLLEIFPENNSLWFVNGVLQSANNLKVNAGDTLMKITQNSTDSCFAKEQIRLGGEGAQNQLADLANVFTPNGDGINDVFGPKNPSDFLCAELKIYNRWGLLIFQSKVGSPPVWDGRSPSSLELPEGVYFYVFSIGEESQRGSVNLMR